MNKKFLSIILLNSITLVLYTSQQPLSTSIPQSTVSTQKGFIYPPTVQVVIPNTLSSQAINNSTSSSINTNKNEMNMTNIQKTFVDIKNSIMNSIKQTNITKMLNTWQQYIKICSDDARRRARGFFGQLSQLLWNHKFKVMATVIGSVYGYFFFTSQKANRYLRINNLWSSWKKNLTLEQLLAIPQKQLAQELLADIQTRYVDTNEPTNFLSPLAAFIQETNAELTKLQQYASLSSWVFWLHLTKLLPFNITQEKEVRERIQRLIFLKNLFSSWIAEYKLIHNAPEAGKSVFTAHSA